MFLIVFCVDGPDALSLRAAEFERHGDHISRIGERIRFGAPLAVKDVTVVAGDPSLVASLIVYEAPVMSAGAALALEDPYFTSGAWEALEFYTGPGLSAPSKPSEESRGYYAAFLRRDAAPVGFDQQALERISTRLGDRAALSTLLECEGFASHRSRTTFALRALLLFRAGGLEAARGDLAAALPASDQIEAWTVMCVPRATGAWFGLSPSAAVSEHLARGQDQTPPR